MGDSRGGPNPFSIIAAAAERDFLAIFCNFADPHRRRATLCRAAHPGDFVAGLERALGPPSSREVVRASQFAFPLLGFTRGVFYIHGYKYVRINKLTISDRPGDRYGFRNIVSCRSMMCERRYRDDEHKPRRWQGENHGLR